MWYIFVIYGLLFFILILVGSISSNSDENLQRVEQGRMSKVTYKEHSYVVWSVNSGGGMTHDPDCPCMAKNRCGDTGLQ